MIKSIEFHQNDKANYILNNFFENRDEISNVLLKHGLKYHNFAFIDSKLIGKSCFSFLREFDYPDLIDILIEKVDIDVNHKEPIKEEIEVIEKEEEEEEQNEININEYNEITPLSMALESNNIEVFKILFAKEKLDVNLKSKYSRSSCLRNHDKFFVGYDDSDDDDDNGDIKYNHINESEKTALFISIEKNNEEILKLLLSNKNIDVNIRNKYINKSESKLSDGETLEIKEKTALYFAVEKGNSNIVELLLQNENNFYL